MTRLVSNLSLPSPSHLEASPCSSPTPFLLLLHDRMARLHARQGPVATLTSLVRRLCMQSFSTSCRRTLPSHPTPTSRTAFLIFLLHHVSDIPASDSQPCSPTCTSPRRTSLRRADQTCTISTSFHFPVHTKARQYTSSPGTIFFLMILPCQTSQNLLMSLPYGRDPSLLSLAINSGKKQVKKVGFLGL